MISTLLALTVGAAAGWELGPFTKMAEPILSPNAEARFVCPVLGREVRWEAQNVYNPAAVVRDGRVWLLYRADDVNPDLRWGRTCRIGLASSADGVHFERHPQPVLYPDNDAYRSYEWEGGCEDLHVVERDDGLYVMNYTTWDGHRDTVSVATSRDLEHWTKHGPAFARAGRTDGRSGVVVSQLVDGRLVAAKLDGHYWMYTTFGCQLAWSDDLIDWTPTGRAVWPGGPREAGAVALLRDDGILLMTQSAHPTLGEWTLRQTLVDRSDRLTVVQDQPEPFLWPEHAWEQHGFCEATTVANALVPFGGRWRLYYGGADRHIGLATGPRVDPHRLLFACEGRRAIVELAADGQVLWQYPAEMARDVWRLPNGNTLFCFNDAYDGGNSGPSGVMEVTPDQRIAFSYRTTGQVWSCQRLADGTTLVGAASQGKLLIVAADGSLQRSIKLLSAGGHSCLRNARQLADGHFLVAEEGAGAVREYAADGTLAREFRVDFPPYSAVRLPDGHTLVCGQSKLVELDEAAKPVWSVTAGELPELGIRWFSGLQVLPNGSVLVSNAGGKVPFFEVDRQGRVLWRWAGPAVGLGHGVQRLDVPGPPVR